MLPAGAATACTFVVVVAAAGELAQPSVSDAADPKARAINFLTALFSVKRACAQYRLRS
jgi:hypothetical protein